MTPSDVPDETSEPSYKHDSSDSASADVEAHSFKHEVADETTERRGARSKVEEADRKGVRGRSTRRSKVESAWGAGPGDPHHVCWCDRGKSRDRWFR
jgi:hypothetical protein